MVTVTLPLVVSTSHSEKVSTGVTAENSVSFLGEEEGVSMEMQGS